MCIACSTFVPDRRRFLSLAAAGVAAASMLGARAAFAAGATTSVTPDEALARLKAGNEKYVSAPQVCAVVVQKHTKFPGSIGPMVDAIVPAAKAVYGKPGDFVDNTVRESAKRTTAKIATKSEIVSHFIKDNKVKVLAARYDLDDGRVEFLT
jgi:hypothetical protein